MYDAYSTFIRLPFGNSAAVYQGIYDIGNQSMKFLCIARKNIELTEQRDED